MYKQIISLILVFVFYLCSIQTLSLSEEVQGDIYYLSLDEVSRLALVNNFDIQLAKFDTYIKRTDQDVAESIFDTVINAEIKYKNDQKKRASTLSASKDINHDYNFGITKKTPSGTTIGIDFDNNRNWTNSSFATTNPAYSSSLGFSVEQELGKNFFGMKDKGDIEITKLDIENFEYTSLDNIEEFLAEAQKAYWKMVLYKESLQIRETMLNQAKKLYDLHQEKIKDGLIEYPEFFASEANVEQKKIDILLAENDLGSTTEELKLLLNVDKNTSAILPKEDLSIYPEEEPLEDSLKRAFDNRRDYIKAKNDIKSKDIKLSIKENDLWPEINLEASFARNGINDSFLDAMNQITDEDNPEYFLGLKISFPLENREAKAGFNKAKLEKAKTLIALKRAERVILKEIINQIRRCLVYQQRVDSQKTIIELQDKKLKGEEKKFNYGRSDTDTIIRYQNDLLNAQLLTVRAAYEYKVALIDLSLTENTLLDKYWKDKI